MGNEHKGEKQSFYLTALNYKNVTKRICNLALASSANLNAVYAPKVPPGSALKRDVMFLRRGSASNMASRLEINFIRLLSRCESIASEKRGETEWRLEKVRREVPGVRFIVIALH